MTVLEKLKLGCILSAFWGLCGCHQASAPAPAPPATPAPPHHSARPEGVAWFDGDVSQAFAAAAEQHKPVFVYFGAVWCPPCQELKATVFRRPDFQRKLSLFVPVFLDGDAPDAQRWASEFKIGGYPTVLILRPDHTEIERVSGGMDLGRYTDVLELGLSAAHPLSQLMASVAASQSPLSAEDCGRLAYNEWPAQDEWRDGNQGWLTSTAANLSKAARLCPEAATVERARLTIISVAARLAAESEALKAGKPPSPALASGIEEVRALLANQDLVVSAADAVGDLDDKFFKAAGYLHPADAVALEHRWFHLMDAVAADPRYSDADHLYTEMSKFDAAKGTEPGGTIPPALADEARQRAEAALARPMDAYTRTSVVNAVLNVLDALHDQDRAYAVLTAEVKTSATPYYYMSDIAELEEERGHKDAAVEWFARAYRESQGPATRFQWGDLYVRALIRLKPDDEAAIGSSAEQVLAELQGEGRIYGRSSFRLERLGKALHTWNADGKHAAVIHQLHAEMDGICGKVQAQDPAHETCAHFLKAV